MPIEILIDDLDGMDYQRGDNDTGLTVGNAIDRAAKDNAVILPARNPTDDVQLNGTGATYQTPIPRDQENVVIEVDTEGYKNRRANAAEKTPGPLRRRPRNRG